MARLRAALVSFSLVILKINEYNYVGLFLPGFKGIGQAVFTRATFASLLLMAGGAQVYLKDGLLKNMLV